MDGKSSASICLQHQTPACAFWAAADYLRLIRTLGMSSASRRTHPGSRQPIWHSASPGVSRPLLRNTRADFPATIHPVRYGFTWRTRIPRRADFIYMKNSTYKAAHEGKNGGRQEHEACRSVSCSRRPTTPLPSPCATPSSCRGPLGYGRQARWVTSSVDPLT